MQNFYYILVLFAEVVTECDFKYKTVIAVEFEFREKIL